MDYQRRLTSPHKEGGYKEEFAGKFVGRNENFMASQTRLIITGSVVNLEICSKMVLCSQSGTRLVADHEVVKGKNYMDWIGMALAKYKTEN